MPEHHSQLRHDGQLEPGPRVLGARHGSADSADSADSAGDHVQQVAEEELQHGVLAIEVVLDRAFGRPVASALSSILVPSRPRSAISSAAP